MILEKYKQLRDGMRVKGKVYGEDFEGMLRIDEVGWVYVCQNVSEGSYADDLKGYEYSRCLCRKNDDFEHWDEYITDLESIDEPTELRAMKVGDIVIDEFDDKRKVLEVLTNTFMCSFVNDFTQILGWYTFEEGEKQGWKIKGQEEEETVELTHEEIAEKFGVDVDKLRIRK